MNDAIKRPQASIGFYVHHQGAGHIMRAITLANALPGLSCFFMGSNLKPYLDIIPREINCIHLPADVPAENEFPLQEANELAYLHYAPLGLRGQRERTALITQAFTRHYPLLLLVDVSVEITLLARLCGIPTLVMRQHGLRDDPAHLLAYESATLLIAPYAKEMAVASSMDWVEQKTLYAGGFSKYSNRPKGAEEEDHRQVAILLGKGGTSLDHHFITHLAKVCGLYTFHVIGEMEDKGFPLQPNIVWHGKLAEPVAVLMNSALVIGNAGHNTVMEMADLNKRFICIPEERTFAEQLQKAELLARNGNARVILPAELNTINWEQELDKLIQCAPFWDHVTDAAALHKISAAIDATLIKLFP